MRCGAIIYATEQGLGYLAKSFHDAGVINRVLIFKHPHGDRPTKTEWYPEGTPVMDRRPFHNNYPRQTEAFLLDVDVVLFFETPFDWEFVRLCKEQGKKTALVTMYEWYLQAPPHRIDTLLCPSLLDLDYFPRGEFIPVPTDVPWVVRTRAHRFLHNAGHIGCRGHKGTLELLQAMQYVKSPLEMTIRCQDAQGLQKLINSVPGIDKDNRINWVYKSVPYDQLFDPSHDVYVAPEKFNGLSLPLQEAYASGMLVITTDRYPANTWLPTQPMIPPSRSRRAQTMRGHLEFDEVIVDPQNIAQVLDTWHGQNIVEYSRKGKEWAKANSWDALKPLYLKALAP